jgi:four helix bundle protein
MSKTYRDLIAWQLGMDLAAACYELTKTLPVTERFGLVSQINKAAVSVPANIAEGYGRSTHADFRRFLGYSNGSLKEVETHLAICVRVNLLPAQTIAPTLGLADRTGAVIRQLARSLQ